MYITLVASVIYVAAWEIYYTNFGSNFGDVYVEYQKQQWTKAGMSAEQISTQVEAQQSMMDMYKNNGFQNGHDFPRNLPCRIDYFPDLRCDLWGGFEEKTGGRHDCLTSGNAVIFVFSAGRCPAFFHRPPIDIHTCRQVVLPDSWSAHLSPCPRPALPAAQQIKYFAGQQAELTASL
ncbi:MAG: DUF4199 domain-containing protein [Bacteroidia bacterium]